MGIINAFLINLSPQVLILKVLHEIRPILNMDVCLGLGLFQAEM